MHAFRKTLLILFVAVAAMIVTNSYAQPADDHCECCVEVHGMMCNSCKVCTAPALISRPFVVAHVAQLPIQNSAMHFNPSKHTEDIWHPPKA
ncbi:MAG TPA: hypothetical protein VL381_03020 [Rhodocyclaceae bacterium]|nr:hypothetical protein [Rhodocyclaceae bacterium]